MDPEQSLGDTMLEEEPPRKGNLSPLAVISSLRGLRDNLRTTIWQPFVLSLGVPMTSLGAMESVLDLIRILVQTPLGEASDVYGRKKFLAAREVLIVMASVLFLLANSWELVFVGVVLLGLSFSLYPVWSTAVAESVEPHELSRAYSIIGTSYTGAGLVGTLGAGFLAQKLGFSFVFGLSLGMGVFSLVLVLLWFKETRNRATDASYSMSRAFLSLKDAMLPPRHLWGFYAAMSVDLFAFSIGWRLLYGMLTQGYGYTPYMIGLLSAVTAATITVSQVPLGRLADRFGYVKFLAASQSISCVIIIAILVSKRFEAVLVAHVLMGVAGALWGPAEQAWIVRNVKDEEGMAKSLSGYATFRGVIGMPAPLIGGALFDAYGFDIPMMVNLVLAIIDIILIVALVKDITVVKPES
jgi:MFS family permease